MSEPYHGPAGKWQCGVAELNNDDRDGFIEWWNDNCAQQSIIDYGFETRSQNIAYHAWKACHEMGEIVPDGWKIVPLVPTVKMVDATFNDAEIMRSMSHNARNKHIYRTMLAASPQPPKEQK